MDKQDRLVLRPNRGYQLRAGFLFMLFAAGFGLIVVRLFVLQLAQQDFFMSRASAQRQVCLSTNPARATILDRYGEPIALSVSARSAFMTPRHLTDEKTITRFLAKKMPAVYQALMEHKDRSFLWVQRIMDTEQEAALRKHNFEDLYWLDEHKRVYPYQSMRGVLGATDIDLHGIDGLELSFHKQLAGLPSTVVYERDARTAGLYVERLVVTQGQQGSPVQTTLDAGLSEQIYEALVASVHELQAQQAAAVVLDPHTGAVHAMVTYNPGRERVDFQRAANAVTCQTYEPGSVFKPFLALAALQEGVIKPDELIDCEGKVTMVNGVRVENWKSVDKLTLGQIVLHSSNVGTAKVGQRLGARYYDHLVRLGFGKKTGIQLPGEAPGFLNHPSRWSRPSLIVLSFGYEVMVTLLQLARAFGVLATGGQAVQPTLLLEKAKRPLVPLQLFEPSVVAEVQSYLSGVGARYPVQDFEVMGKTGTARCVENGQYVKTAHNYTFAGIVRKGDYARVVVTFIARPVKHHLWASETAAPLFARIARGMVARDALRG